MPRKQAQTVARGSAALTKQPRADVRAVLAALERAGTKATRDSMLRYGIVAPKAFGVSMGGMKQIAKGLGRDHAFALKLWETGWYEAQIVASLIADPERLTAAEMERWSKDFDNWGIVDTACFCLFDQSPHAWRKVEQWSRKKHEFVRRAGFALLASLALHDKTSADAVYRRQLRFDRRVCQRRTEFREEGSELGFARDWDAQRSAQQRHDISRAPAFSIERAR